MMYCYVKNGKLLKAFAIESYKIKDDTVSMIIYGATSEEEGIVTLEIKNSNGVLLHRFSDMVLSSSKKMVCIQNTKTELVFKHAVDKRKKLYLSGPMSVCKDEATWKNNFQTYEHIFELQGYEVINPSKNSQASTYGECMKNALRQELECDCIFMLPNSILSNGARLEYEVAKACGLEIINIDDDISFTNNYETKSGISLETSNSAKG